MISKSVLNKSCFATKIVVAILIAMVLILVTLAGLRGALILLALPDWALPATLLVACFGYIFYIAYTQAPRSVCVKEDNE